MKHGQDLSFTWQNLSQETPAGVGASVPKAGLNRLSDRTLLSFGTPMAIVH